MFVRKNGSLYSQKDIILLPYKMSKDHVFSLILNVIFVQGLLSSRGGQSGAEYLQLILEPLGHICQLGIFVCQLVHGGGLLL